MLDVQKVVLTGWQFNNTANENVQSNIMKLSSSVLYIKIFKMTGAPAGFKNVDAQPVGSGASLREMIRNIDNYFAIG